PRTSLSCNSTCRGRLLSTRPLTTTDRTSPFESRPPTGSCSNRRDSAFPSQRSVDETSLGREARGSASFRAATPRPASQTVSPDARKLLTPPPAPALVTRETSAAQS